MQLKDIQVTIQQIGVAISSVLKLEVEIADHELYRIAGTGAVKSGIWQKMSNEDFVYRECLNTGKPVIVDRPGYHKLCGPCMHYRNCKEHGEVCCPILLDGRVLGVIGLIAFTNEQRDRLFTDLEAKIEFLDKMAELIATKMKETELLEEQLLAERKMSTLIGYIDNGVILIDPAGECTYLNQAASRLLELPDGQLPDISVVEQCLTPFIRDETASRMKRITDSSESDGKLAVVKTGGKYIHLFLTYHPFHEGGEGQQDGVLVIADPKRMADVAMKYSEESHKGFDTIIGNHPLIESLKDLLRKTANSYSPILLQGENGTGKEFIAESIHRYSKRKDAPYLTVNCAVLTEKVLHHRLFGDELQNGIVAEANGGVLFLDDIHEMPMSIQLKLLHLLEEKVLWLSGNAKPAPLNVRLIAATDKELDKLVGKGLFRRDLYYKISVIPIDVPPLRARKQDILLLANHFLQEHSQANRKHIRTLSEDVKAILLSYHWPGNIRELSNIIEYAVNFSNATTIGKEHLPASMRNIELTTGAVQPTDFTYNLRTLERDTIQRALANVQERGEPKENAAKWLGISRATLFRKLQQYDLNG
ncbi:hypothetical protein PSTEL_10730 [Paenibacillus stellifer]|uniref:Transcriptional regulator n=1 Tax=Paenibacillus stellifer TaxID=169760 RepID=A0A089LRI1_9BACL|nr:sigma 54-interacting transcriptional regulator [Paenibacillus stellifer]AIQ63482.1 hypothetical protein PSTEL_10730 [Paenibacillus stellifer]